MELIDKVNNCSEIPNDLREEIVSELQKAQKMYSDYEQLQKDAHRLEQAYDDIAVTYGRIYAKAIFEEKK